MLIVCVSLSLLTGRNYVFVVTLLALFLNGFRVLFIGLAVRSALEFALVVMLPGR